MTFDLGIVVFYVLRNEIDGKRTQYEATVIDFEDHSELLRVVDTSNQMTGTLEKGSTHWFTVHSFLSEKGILKGK